MTNPFVDEVYTVWEFAKEDGSEALMSAVATKIYANEAPIYVEASRSSSGQVLYIGRQTLSGRCADVSGLCVCRRLPKNIRAGISILLWKKSNRKNKRKRILHISAESFYYLGVVERLRFVL